MKLQKILKTVYNYGLSSSMDMRDYAVLKSLDDTTQIPYIRHELYKYFYECFTDGYHGDESCADNYAEEMCCRIISELGVLKEFLNITTMLTRLPPMVYKALSINNVFLAGGGALKAILNKNWENSDWDLFYYPSSERQLMELFSKHNMLRNNHGYPSYDVVNGNQKIQLIYKEDMGNPLMIVQDFDITICQFGIYGKIPCVFGTDAAFIDLKNGVININTRAAYNSDREMVKARINKYVNRGFSKSSELDAFINNIPIKIIAPNRKKKKTTGFVDLAQPHASHAMPEMIDLAHAMPPEWTVAVPINAEGPGNYETVEYLAPDDNLEEEDYDEDIYEEPTDDGVPQI